ADGYQLRLPILSQPVGGVDIRETRCIDPVRLDENFPVEPPCANRAQLVLDPAAGRDDDVGKLEVERHAFERVVSKHVIGVGRDASWNLQQESRYQRHQGLVVKKVRVQILRTGELDVTSERETHYHGGLSQQGF